MKDKFEDYEWQDFPDKRIVPEPIIKETDNEIEVGLGQELEEDDEDENEEGEEFMNWLSNFIGGVLIGAGILLLIWLFRNKFNILGGLS